MRTLALRVLVSVWSLTGLLLLCLAPSGAAAAALPTVDTVQVGPVKAADGFDVYVTEQACGSSASYFQVAFVKGSSPDVISHTYTGFNATCSIERTPAGAELSADLPGVLNINVHIDKAGRALRHPGLPVGCGAPFGPELPATATGRIDVAIHTSIFGRVGASRSSAQIFSGAPQQCPAVQSSDGRQFTADVGPFILNAVAPEHGAAVLDIFDQTEDTPAAGITGSLQLEVGGRQAYAVTSASGSATLGAGAPFTTGSLAFSPLPACPGYAAESGNVTGTLTINDPLFGPLVISGEDASVAFSGEGTAHSGVCNGPGSDPVQPSMVTSCNLVSSDCSISAGTGAATFFDETSPGTQTITSEQVNFGDGSAPVPITNYGSVQHGYTTAGTFTATLTVTDSSGTTTTSTTPVYIEP
jgi:hypothetical protein